METIVHAILGYVFLLVVVRVLKRRAGAQMTLFEFVLVFLMGGVIILSTVGKDRSVTHCTCAVIAVGLVHGTLSWAKSKGPRIGAVIDGTPLVVINEGRWQEEMARGLKIRPEDNRAAARAKGVRSLEELDYAIVERNGGISMIKKS
jgi:uncharacterized membrane protein YcaP (DUF421 family)